MSVPGVWAFVLLALAAYRVWKLLADDAILDGPRRRILKRWPSEKLALFMDCPFCLGFWVALAWWGAWQAWPHGSLVAAVPFALSAAVGGYAVAVGKLAE